MRSQSVIVADFEEYRQNRSKAFYASTDKRKNLIVDNIINLIRNHITTLGEILNPITFIQGISRQIYIDIMGMNGEEGYIAGECHDRSTLVGKLFELQYEICRYLIKNDDAVSLRQIHAHFTQRSCCPILSCVLLEHDQRSNIDYAPTQLRLDLQHLSNSPAVMSLFVEIRLQIARISNRHARGLQHVYSFLMEKNKQIETKKSETFKVEDVRNLQQIYNQYVERYHPRGLVFAYKIIPLAKDIKTVKNESKPICQQTLFAEQKPMVEMQQTGLINKR